MPESKVPEHESPEPGRQRRMPTPFVVVFVLAAVVMVGVTVCGGLALAVWLASR